MGTIARVGVIGAGTMGAGIAAQVANAGVEVVLLDIVPAGAGDRRALATGAIARLLKQQPAPFMHRDNARRIRAGNLEDDLGLLADCDWICEAVLEDPKVKRDLYGRLETVRRDGSIVTSNTSTIPLASLVDGLPERLRRDFAITHFFNPPRYMRLMELVGGPDTRADALASLRAFCDERLGKQVIDARDTPGFIANRIGIYWSYVAMSEALRLGLTVEEADSIVGRPMGVPKTGIFGLADLTGIDLAPHVNASMLRLLPPDDPFVRDFDAAGPLPKLIDTMIAKGRTGRKTGAGFYRRAGGRREALDLATGDYRATAKARLDSAAAGAKDLRALVTHPDRGGRYAWSVLSRTLAYAARLAPEIARGVADVDAAMRTGYAWKWGPFELVDRLGAAWLAERLAVDGLEVPPLLAAAGGRSFYRTEGRQAQVLGFDGAYEALEPPAGAWSLADAKRGAKPVLRNGSASIWDIGDGVACLEFHTKMNALDQDSIAMLMQGAGLAKQGWKALVIGGDADNFSVGANIGIALFAANAALWPLIEQTAQALQNAVLGLRDAPFPVVAAVHGLTLGGGCEIALHCDAVQAAAETYIGLPEAGVGLIPGGGGTKELLARCWTRDKRPGGPMPPISQAFETIALAKVATSAQEARDLLFLRPGDGISMNRARLLADAKRRALELAAAYTKREPVTLNLPGATARAALDLVVEGLVVQGKATPHDRRVAAELAVILSGGDTDMLDEVGEKQLLALERQAFMNLVRTGPTLDRIEHMLDTGRPLRN